MHHNAKNLTGIRFGMLVAIEPDGKDKGGRIYWRCACDCGTEKRVRGAHLTAGSISSCGCNTSAAIAEKVKTHGHSSGGKISPIYSSWAHMIARCTNPRNNRFKRYGGRGISVCDRWMSFAAFLADMGSGWAPGLSIDRIDNDGNYEPGNCKWSSPKEQANNRNTWRGGMVNSMDSV